MGRELVKMGKIKFSIDVYIFISSRRMRELGFFKFNRLFFYVLENFFPSFSKSKKIASLKKQSKVDHHASHEIEK